MILLFSCRPLFTISLLYRANMTALSQGCLLMSLMLILRNESFNRQFIIKSLSYALMVAVLGKYTIPFSISALSSASFLPLKGTSPNTIS